jgi:pyocin large subunit-like protein
MSYIKKEYYKLRRVWKETKQEYKDIEQLYESIEKQFVFNIIKFCQDNNLANPFTESSAETQNVSRDNSKSSSFNKLFRKIVTNTHPDKNKKIKNKEEIYNAATKARKEGNLQELLDAGHSVSVKPDISSITVAELDLLQSNIDELKDKIQKTKNSYPWVWFHSNPSKRNIIFYNFIESAKKNN